MYVTSSDFCLFAEAKKKKIVSRSILIKNFSKLFSIQNLFKISLELTCWLLCVTSSDFYLFAEAKKRKIVSRSILIKNFSKLFSIVLLSVSKCKIFPRFHSNWRVGSLYVTSSAVEMHSNFKTVLDSSTECIEVLVLSFSSKQSLFSFATNARIFFVCFRHFEWKIQELNNWNICFSKLFSIQNLSKISLELTCWIYVRHFEWFSQWNGENSIEK